MAGPLRPTANGCTHHDPPPPPTTTSTRCRLRCSNWFQSQSANIIFAILSVGILIGLVLPITLVCLPSRPNPNDPKCTLQSFSQPVFNISNLQLSATWNASFRIVNPDKKKTVQFKQLMAYVYYHKTVGDYGDLYLAGSPVPEFKLGPREERAVDVGLVAENWYLDAQVINDINYNKQSSGGEMKWDVSLGYATDEPYFWCDNVYVSNSSSGSMVGGPKFCKKL